jgi:thiol-disulfide isomerase/thioredoxin
MQIQTGRKTCVLSTEQLVAQCPRYSMQRISTKVDSMRKFANTATAYSIKFAAIAISAIPIASLAETRAGPTLDLAQYRGKVVYLDFWASWCAPCLQSFPWMNEIQRTYGRQGLIVLAVNVDHDGNLAQQFLRDKFVEFKILYDSNGAIARQYDLKDMPTSILIGPDGRIRYVHNGFYVNRKTEYASHIIGLLHEIAR